MRYLISLAIAGVGMAAASSAMAQERAPFTGPRVEALVGYDSLSTDHSDNSVDGLHYGAGVGYDVQAGGVILGIEGEVAGSTARIRDTDVFVAGDRLRYKADRDLYVGGRIGYAIRPTTLLYAKGGYTNQRISIQYDNPAGAFAEDHTTLDGWRAGAGIEQKFNMFGPGGYVKVEYRYSNYNNANYGQQNADIDLDRHQVVGGVGVRF